MAALELDLVPEIRAAIEDRAFVLHFQPEVDLASGAVVGMEALLRWQHPRRGLLWPAEFLPVAEAAGLSVPIGEWVLEQCVAELQEWEKLPPRIDGEQRRLWVNVSALELASPRFVERVAKLTADAGITPGTLGVEVTEETLATGMRRSVELLAALHQAGVVLGIDDFGTWYSSLATLGELPVDAVKLDRSFVRGVGSDLDDDTIVASVIRLAHAHDLYVVGEGVESWAEGARLCELGCDRGIGYLFSGPVPATRARWMLSRGTGWRGSYLSGRDYGAGEGSRDVWVGGRPLA